jgi:hypothetical protein
MGLYLRAAMSALRGVPVWSYAPVGPCPALSNPVQSSTATKWKLHIDVTQPPGSYYGQLAAKAVQLSPARTATSLSISPDMTFQWNKSAVAPPFLVVITDPSSPWPPDRSDPQQMQSPGLSFYLYT